MAEIPQEVHPKHHGSVPEAQWTPLDLLLREDDAYVSEHLHRHLTHDPSGAHTTVLWQPRVLSRVYALQDEYLTPLILILAQGDHLGLELLFDARLMPRFASLHAGHLWGTFLPFARYLPGFEKSERRWLQMVDEARQAGHGAHAVLINGADLKEEALDWLWEPYIAKKAITIVDGDPGVGKTMVACQLAASVSRGYPLPDQAGKMTMGSGKPGAVLMVGMEDHLGSVVRKRLLLCDADMAHLTFCNDIVDAEGQPRPFTLEDLPLLEAYMEAQTPVLVYIDAIQGVLGGKVDIGSPNKIKALLVPLDRLAQDYACAIVCSRHPAKPGQNTSRLIHRGMGSQSFIGTARSGLFVEEDPGDKTRSMLIHYKSNMGALGRTQLFRKAQGMFQWAGVSRIDESVLAGAGRGPNPYALLEACFWLEHQLVAGVPKPSSAVEAAAAADEIAEGVLKRAKKVLGVQSTQVSGQAHGGWLWYLPPLTNAITSSEATEPTEPTELTEAPDLESTTYRDTQPPMVSGDSVGAEGSVDAAVSEDPATLTQRQFPCAMCGGTERWHDADVWRCGACWPQSLDARGRK